MSGYYTNTETTVEYCDICHTSCAECYGPLETNCITCADRFDFVAENSTCTAPNNSTDKVIIKAYTVPGFTKLTDWTVTNFDDNTFQCSTVTLLGGKVNTNSAS